MWDMWIAASCGGALQERIFDLEHAFLNTGKNKEGFPDRFCVNGSKAGVQLQHHRPTLGSTFAALALKRVSIG